MHSQYLYAEMEGQIEVLLHKVRDLLAKESALTAQLAHYGYPSKGAADVTQCLHALDVLLADDSPIYTSEAF
jgi:hypothetical protein